VETIPSIRLEIVGAPLVSSIEIRASSTHSEAFDCRRVGKGWGETGPPPPPPPQPARTKPERAKQAQELILILAALSKDETISAKESENP
jgi:hypothetical protein